MLRLRSADGSGLTVAYMRRPSVVWRFCLIEIICKISASRGWPGVARPGICTGCISVLTTSNFQSFQDVCFLLEVIVMSPALSLPTVTEVKDGVGAYPLARDYVDFNRYDVSWLGFLCVGYTNCSPKTQSSTPPLERHLWVQSQSQNSTRQEVVEGC